MLSAVSNSGPIIHITEINQLRLFDLFGALTIPASVFEEIGRLDLKNAKIVPVSEKDTVAFIKSLGKFKLQKAEADALYLAKNTNAMFLTDDLEARDAAVYLGIEVHGSLGIISMAYKKKAISLAEAKQYVLELYNNSTLFLTKALVDLVISELEKSGR